MYNAKLYEHVCTGASVTVVSQNSLRC